MSFGGPRWPQEPHQPDGAAGHDPYGQQQPAAPYGGPYGQQQPQDPGAGQGPYGQGQGRDRAPYAPGQEPYDQGREPFGQRPAAPFGATADGTPDWSALAEASEARQRRRRRLVAAGGVLATAAIATVVAVAVVNGGSGGGTAPAASATTAPPGGAEVPTDGTGPQPSFSPVAPAPPPDPMDFLSTAAKDTAPLTPEGLFPGRKLTFGDRVYAKGATASTTECAGTGQGGLGAVLREHGCARVIRATYVRDGVAVTVGVAVFADQGKALAAKEGARGGIAPLAGAGVGDFCRATVCLRRSNALGRYAYFTQAGFTDGRKVTTSDTAVYKTSDDLGSFTFNQIYARGRAQASAAATAPAGGQ
ncbi:hypothetical protein [Streptomyces sp. DH12]|uniref:hypothetical protein n=1 Tax=Streptomyces sp. DH12 TaxID=2857010 RepID=UPI001E649B7F|nr:hypothetical protein [Streptomyces sp. DH12]